MHLRTRTSQTLARVSQPPDTNRFGCVGWRDMLQGRRVGDMGQGGVSQTGGRGVGAVWVGADGLGVGRTGWGWGGRVGAMRT